MELDVRGQIIRQISKRIKAIKSFGLFVKTLKSKHQIILHLLKDTGSAAKKCGTLHDFACHPCAGAMLIFSVSFQF